MKVHNLGSGKGLIKAWTDHVNVDENTLEQAKEIAGLPFIFKHLALMPDCHLGKGSTVGSVIPTVGAVIPSAVGVDIGCGMIACELKYPSFNLEKHHIAELRHKIEKVVPAGRTDNGGSNDRGAWSKPPDNVQDAWAELEKDPHYRGLIDKYKELKQARTVTHLGTLGTGNHFIEVQKEKYNDNLWVMIHSGSRGIGAKIGNFFMQLAKEHCQKYYVDRWLNNMDLSFFVQGSPEYTDYLAGMKWAQSYAWKNRELMMENALKELRFWGLNPNQDLIRTVHCHHNYADIENHFGHNVLVTRKGAIRARENDWGLIPGAMGVESYVVVGKGNKDSFTSASHGAGRVMSRAEAFRRFTVEQHAESTKDIECDKTIGTLDETKECYKNINDVLLSEADLIEVKYTLEPLMVIKGISDKSRGKKHYQDGEDS